MTVTEAAKTYLKKCKIRNLAQKTQDNYRLSLSTFTNFYKGTLDKLTQDDIDDYISGLQDKDISLTTVNNRLRDLRAFLKWCESKGYIRGITIQLIKQNEPEIHAFTPQELKGIYDACMCTVGKKFQQGNGFCAKRNYIIMKVLEETGMRISECLRIRINDIDLKELTIFLPETRNKKSRVVYITPGLAKEIKFYLELRQQFLGSKKLAATSLFSNINGGELNISTIQDAISLYGKMAGLDYIRVSPHTFRHTFAKNFLLNGGDIFTLKDILGHSSLEMVYRYARLWDQERHKKYAAVMEKYNRSKKRIAK